MQPGGTATWLKGEEGEKIQGEERKSLTSKQSDMSPYLMGACQAV